MSLPHEDHRNQSVGKTRDPPHETTGQGDEHHNPNTIFWIVGFLLIGLLLLGITVGLYFWWKKRSKRSIPHSLASEEIAAGSSAVEVELVPRDGQLLPNFTYEELEAATDMFAPSNILGEGDSGRIYKGKLQDQRLITVKQLYGNSIVRHERFTNEVTILCHLQHPNIISLYGCTPYGSEEQLIVYEFMRNGTLADHLHGPRSSQRALTWPIRLRIANNIALAIYYLHTLVPPVILRDLKSNNIFLHDNLRAKIGDFGLSRQFVDDEHSHVSIAAESSTGRVDQDYVMTYHLTQKTDVFAFGVLLVELITSKPLIDTRRPLHEINITVAAVNKLHGERLQDLVYSTLELAPEFEADQKTQSMIKSLAILAFKCLKEMEMRPSMRTVVQVLEDLEG